jgi:hypothetical protein
MDASLLTKLSEPFAAKDISWLPGAAKEGKCLAMPYADLRVYQDALDAICGINWDVRYAPWGDRLICELTIGGVTRSSTGESEPNDKNAGTVAEAQAFKRACAMFGLGRYIYSLPSVWVEYDAQKRRITDQAERELIQRYDAWFQRRLQRMDSLRSPHANGAK